MWEGALPFRSVVHAQTPLLLCSKLDSQLLHCSAWCTVHWLPLACIPYWHVQTFGSH
jgi:hypothetical protein